MAIRNLSIEKNAIAFLKGLVPKHMRQVQLAIYRLMENPIQHDSSELKGYEDVWRNDVGEYRIVYQFDDESITVMGIGNRNDNAIYKQIKRKIG